MLSLDEIKCLISKSNEDAICRKRGQNKSYPRGMAELITHLHEYKAVNEDRKGWIGRNSSEPMKHESFLPLYLGAFARNSRNNYLSELKNKKRTTSVYNLFSCQYLMGIVSDLYQASKERYLSIMDVELDPSKCETLINCSFFWEKCAENNVSTIYAAKTLSMIFPDLFVPFDSTSYRRIYENKELIGISDNNKLPSRYQIVSFDNYLDIHKGYKNLIDNLMKTNELDVDDLRRLSLYVGDGEKCKTEFKQINNQVFCGYDTPPPPPLTRFLDKIFYTPRGDHKKEKEIKTRNTKKRSG